ncbi:lytic murein transglycosylase [Pseudochrobactrum kiredjianiae]|uniref:Lytic murein transglycosylase n=1 Tax=Pseudochrobactrum kiredjianiae TaxID=386305 RepID=A0ABW3V428_9HYPH|nr:lytic murein transglycosylase [Pseudochrobactrum kiredjianiae]MDM7851087.1 lytic murein transglycosylase [Pseudochrobactrum kiredjianiae]
MSRPATLPAFRSVLKPLLTAATLLSSASLAFATTVQPAAPSAPAAVEIEKPACGGEYNLWLEGVITEAKAAGISDSAIAELHKATLDERTLKRDRTQSVFNLTFAEFSKRLISEQRLKKGRENLVKYADIFKKAEETYGVPGPVIAAFWGLETDFGAIQGDFDTLNSLVTLSHDCRRPELFRPQLMAMLKLIDQGVVDAGTMGAWAGEIGQMQLLPKDYLERGVDGDGDGKVDLRNSVADAVMTAARMLSELGWQRGEPWLETVQLTQDLPWENSIRTYRLPHSKWSNWGVKTADGSALGADDGDASLLIPMGRKGPAFLSYRNFDIFVEWNKSIVYATTAAYFAARLAGSEPFLLGTPVEGLTTEELTELQNKLVTHGYDMGRIDGVFGTKTRDAVRTEQLRLGMPADSWPTRELLEKL